jgi:HPt (histidine-containing phosphotransfer) domain-containing protein
MNSADILDREVISTLRSMRRNGPRNILLQLLTTFREGTPGLLESIRNAAAEGDAAKLEKAAHSLKGSSLTIGATRMGQLTAEIERCGREKVLGDVDSLIAQLEHEFHRASEAAGREMAIEN